MLKKTAFFITLALLLNLCVPCGMADTVENDVDAYAYLEEKVSSSNLTAEADDRYDLPVTIKDGLEGREMTSDTKSRNLNFNINNALLYQNNGSKSVEIEVEYFDEGTGRFALRYDGVNNKAAEYDEFVFLTNSGRWQTHIFKVDDGYFGDRYNSRYDFAIALYTDVMGSSPTPIVFRSVKLRINDCEQTAKLSIKNGALGGIFFTGERPFVNLVISSRIVRRNTVDLIYTLYDEGGNLCWQDRQYDYKISFSPKTIPVYPEIDKYGIYKLRIEAENREKNIYSVAEREISYVNSDGKTVNDDYGISPRFSNATWYTPDDIEKSQRLLKMTGAGYVRTSESWNRFETVKGSYVLSDLYKESVEANKNYGTNIFLLASYGNVLYGMNDSMSFPYTEEQLEAWEKYCYNLVKMSEGANDYLEIWNEPNASTFNSDNRTPEDYVKLLEYGYRGAKAADPNVKIAGMSITGLNLEWASRILKAGGGEYMDCFAVHPYSFPSSPIKGGVERKINSYRETFAEYGYGDMPFIVTEMGWASSLQDGIDMYEQANYFVQNYVVLKGLGVEKLVSFTLHDTGVANGSPIFNRQYNFGLLKYFRKGNEESSEIPNVWGAKPAYLAVANMNMHLADCTYIDRTVIDDEFYLYKFRRNTDNRIVYVLWNEDSCGQLTLKSTSTDIKIYDQYGNELPLTPVDGAYSFLVDNSVIYIEGDDFELKKADNIFNIEKTDFNATQNEYVRIGVTTSLDDKFEINPVYADSNAKIADTYVIEDGKGEFVFSSGCGILGDNQYAGIEIKAGDKLYLTGKLRCKYINLTESTFDAELESLNNYNRWTAYIDVTNNRSDVPISGNLTITEPEFIAKSIKNIQIPEIKPGETKRVEFRLPEVVEKGIYDVSAKATWSTGDVQPLSGKLNFTVATYAEVRPTIDGKIEEGEWNFGAQMLLRRNTQAYNLQGFTWTGEDDLSAKVATCWDDENLYICVVAKDDTNFITTGSDIGRYIYKGDTFQFAISYEKGMGLTNSTDLYTNIGVSQTTDGEYVYVYASEEITIKVGETKECECKIVRDGDYTTYEMAFPWSQIVSTTVDIKAGDKLAFTFLLNDNDGSGRKGWLEYTPGLGANANSNHFARLTLLPKYGEE